MLIFFGVLDFLILGDIKLLFLLFILLMKFFLGFWSVFFVFFLYFRRCVVVYFGLVILIFFFGMFRLDSRGVKWVVGGYMDFCVFLGGLF